VPDFNFAGPPKDRHSREPEAIPAPELSGENPPTDVPRSFTADPLPAAFDTSPPEPARQRRAASAAPQASTQPPPAACGADAQANPPPTVPPVTPPAAPRASVLDAYPPRQHRSAGATPPPSPVVASVAPPDDSAAPPQLRRRQPAWLIALNVFLGVLILASGLWLAWYNNAVPALTRALRPVFGTRHTPNRPKLRTQEDRIIDSVAADTAAPPLQMRSWEYYVQVSSWSSLRKAETDAQRFKGAGMDAYVESEFFPKRRSTLYRVRIGPFDSREAARVFRRAQAGRLPAGAFIDSMRVEDTVIDSTAAQAPARRTGGGAAESSARTAGRSPIPRSGFAVKVSSFREEGVARDEARRLLEAGYPSFVTRIALDDGPWYRVLVGPFSTRADADRYAQLLSATHGNDVYIIDLARE
jgi:cell division septation protein DedD